MVVASWIMGYENKRPKKNLTNLYGFRTATLAHGDIGVLWMAFSTIGWRWLNSCRVRGRRKGWIMDEMDRVAATRGVFFLKHFRNTYQSWTIAKIKMKGPL